ncbi:MAG TPA: hypothetical protein EYH05_01665 [Anaerolineae bacterium]|nr:hypothetical protein [Anaerolineae bacterium]
MGKYLSLIGRIFTPLAMVVFLTLEISQSIQADDTWRVAVVIGAAATAVGIEVTGMLAGHGLEGYWRAKDKYRAALSLFLLMIYSGAAMYMLRHNTILLPLPSIAAIVYLAAALTESLEEQKEASASETNWQRQQQAAATERQHQLELARLQADSQLKQIQSQQRAKVKLAKLAKANQQPAASQPEPADRRHICESCGRGFASIQALNAHGRAHQIKVESNSNGNI